MPMEATSAAMSKLETLTFSHWNAQPEAGQSSQITGALERGKVLFLPQLGFALSADEQRFLSPRWSDGKAKNISYDPGISDLRHTSALDQDRAALTALMARFARQARALVIGLCPGYADALRDGLTSFRPVAVAGRASSVTKDDTRLHIDAFASRPNQGERILRVFCNINPQQEPRIWELGVAFEAMVAHFRNRIPPQWPGSAWLLDVLGITKGRRSAYDHTMLSLHDGAKRDDAYQQSTPKERIAFPAHSTWVVYTDLVMHAALGGQYLLEQTFYLPVMAMQDETRAPLRILEHVLQRKLA
jgi:hypothetical protein